jgi:hypothetical protein
MGKLDEYRSELGELDLIRLTFEIYFWWFSRFLSLSFDVLISCVYLYIQNCKVFRGLNA